MQATEICNLQDKIESVLSSNIHPDDTPAIKMKLESLSTFLSTGASCIAESKRLLLMKRREWLRKYTDKIKDFSPSVVKEYVNTACIDEEILFVRCERNYSAIVHSCDVLRSLLSIAKAELSL